MIMITLMSPMRDRLFCNPLMYSDDHTGIPSVFIMQVSQFVGSVKLFLLQNWHGGMRQRSHMKNLKNVIKYHVYNTILVQIALYTIVHLVYKNTMQLLTSTFLCGSLLWCLF